jgi:hypothetical protein
MSKDWKALSAQITAERKEEIADKIASEGFAYYFMDYGPDEELKSLIGAEIKEYEIATSKLEGALLALGIDLDR